MDDTFNPNSPPSGEDVQPQQKPFSPNSPPPDIQPVSEVEQKLALAHKHYMDHAEEYWGRTSPAYMEERIPAVNIGAAIGHYVNLSGAIKGMKSGTPSDDDINTLAQFKARQDYEAQKSSGGQAVDLVTKVPSLVAEFAVSGGAGTAAKEAAGATVAKYAGEGLASKAAGYAANLATRTALTPSMYLDHAVNTNIEKNRDPLDPRGLPGAMGLALAQNAVLGEVGRFTGKVFTGEGVKQAAGRVAVQAASGPFAQAATDAVTGFAGLSTGYGTGQMIYDGKYGEALQHAAMDALTFGSFGLAHEIAGGANHEETVKKVVEKIGATLDAQAKAGATPDQAAEALNKEVQPLKEAAAQAPPPEPPKEPVPKARPDTINVPPEQAPPKPKYAAHADDEDLIGFAKAFGMSASDKAKKGDFTRADAEKFLKANHVHEDMIEVSKAKSQVIRPQAPEEVLPTASQAEAVPQATEAPTPTEATLSDGTIVRFGKYQGSNPDVKGYDIILKDGRQGGQTVAGSLEEAVSKVEAQRKGLKPKAQTPVVEKPPEAAVVPEPPKAPAKKELTPAERQQRDLQMAVEKAEENVALARQAEKRGSSKQKTRMMEDQLAKAKEALAGVSTKPLTEVEKSQVESDQVNKNLDILRAGEKTAHEAAGLTNDESDIHFALTLEGKSLRQVAKERGISHETARQKAIEGNRKLGILNEDGTPMTPAQVGKHHAKEIVDRAAESGLQLDIDKVQADPLGAAKNVSQEADRLDAHANLWKEYLERRADSDEYKRLTPEQRITLDESDTERYLAGKEPPANAGPKYAARQRKNAKRKPVEQTSVQPSDSGELSQDSSQRPPVAPQEARQGERVGSPGQGTEAASNELMSPKIAPKEHADAITQAKRSGRTPAQAEELVRQVENEVAQQIQGEVGTARSGQEAGSNGSAASGPVDQPNSDAEQRSTGPNANEPTGGGDFGRPISEAERREMPGGGSGEPGLPARTPKFKLTKGEEGELKGYSLRHLSGKEYGLYQSEAEAKDAAKRFSKDGDYSVAEVWGDPAFGSPITPEERGSLPGGGQPNAPEQPRPKKFTALANEKIDQERAASGKPPMMEAARQTNPETWDKAMDRLEKDPEAGAKLVEELSKKPRSTTAEENALLLHRKIAVSNELERAAIDSIKAMRDGDMLTISEAEGRYDKLSKDSEAIDRVARETGTEWGRAGQFRRQLAAEDFSLGGMMREAQAAKGRPLTPEERAQILDLSQKIKELQDKLSKAEDDLRKAVEIGGGKAGSKAYTDWTKARGEVRKATGGWQDSLKGDRDANKPFSRRMEDWLTKVRRAFVISSPTTFLKIVAASAERLGIAPFEEAVGGAISKIPLFAKIAEAAPREGRFSIETEKKAFASAWGQGLIDAMQTAKTGKSDLDVQYGENKGPRSLWDLPGELHAAAKAPAVRAEYTRSFQNRVEAGLAKGEDVTSPAALIRIGTEAYKDSQRAKFQQDNRVVQAYQRAIDTLTAKDASAGARALGTGLKLALPVVKIPTNLIAETLQYATGSVTGSVRMGLALKNGVENLKPAEAELIMRSLKKGSLGLAVLALGYANPKIMGGFYSGKRDEGEVEAGGIKTPAGTIPSWAMHNPLLEVLQMGATIRRASDKLYKGNQQGTAEGVVAGMAGLAEEVPFMREAKDLSSMISTSPRERGYAFGQFAKSLAVPQLVQWIAGQTDKKIPFNPSEAPVKRKPETVTQHIETGIPILRKRVPAK